jgi:hypothetical protein
VAGAIVIAWRWRLALAGTVLIHLGAASMLVYVHDVPGVVAAGQMGAVLLCAAMLALAGVLQPHPVSLEQAANWPLRSLALLFIFGAWWFLDPGYTLPYFTLLETELLIWTALCALVMWGFSASPLFGGIAVLLWSTPLFALAAVLLPGSGLAAVVGLADLLVVLACGYLVLLEPAARRAAPRTSAGLLPRLRPAASRPWGLLRQPGQPRPGQPRPGEPASVAPSAAQPQAALPAPAEGREEAASV